MRCPNCERAFQSKPVDGEFCSHKCKVDYKQSIAIIGGYSKDKVSFRYSLLLANEKDEEKGLKSGVALNPKLLENKEQIEAEFLERLTQRIRAETDRLKEKRLKNERQTNGHT